MIDEKKNDTKVSDMINEKEDDNWTDYDLFINFERGIYPFGNEDVD